MENFKSFQKINSNEKNAFETIDPFRNKDISNNSEKIYNKFKNLIENETLEYLLEIKYMIEKKLEEIN